MKALVKKTIVTTIPVMTGYIVLGIGFGILLKKSGYGFIWALLMSGFIYAGSMQYAGIGLLTGGASLITVALTTLMVNARHLFYGISVIDKYKEMGKKKPYLIFGLTDETYALVVKDNSDIKEEDRGKFYFLVTLFDQIYWVTGSLIGVLIGSLLEGVNTDGIDFVLTALFVTIVTDQWLKTKKHLPAIIGAIASVISVVIFGSANFLIPAMILIASALLLMGHVGKWEVPDEQ